MTRITVNLEFIVKSKEKINYSYFLELNRHHNFQIENIQGPMFLYLKYKKKEVLKNIHGMCECESCLQGSLKNCNS